MREYIRRGLRWAMRGAPATADTIEPGSIVVAPRKPIDREDEAAITEVLDLATKVGAVLLDSGTGAIDTGDQVAFVAGIYGLDDVDVDVTFNTIIVSARRGSTLPPIITMRTVHYRSHDFTRLAQVDRLIRRIRTVAITPDTAHRIVDDILAARHPYPYWAATLAWGFLASGVAIYLGGTWLVALTAFFTSIVIVATNRRLNRIGTPVFFQQLTGGFIAVIPAAAVFRWTAESGLAFLPSQIIAAGIVVLLSGLSLVGAVQDAITGAPITAAARFTEVLVMTGGILVGVALGIRLMAAFGLTLPSLTTVTPFGAAELPARIAGGAIAAAAFAFGAYAEQRALPAAVLSGILGSGVVASLSLTQIGNVSAYAVAAILVGLIGGLAARRALTPPLVIAVAGITPLLPGLTIYRALYGLMSGRISAGLGEAATAVGLGCALAAGVTLGEFVARSLRRPTVKLALPHHPRQALRARREARAARRFGWQGRAGRSGTGSLQPAAGPPGGADERDRPPGR
ncbi:threonine/serine exporter ThrE family protein [Gordonia sp. VNK21]|uniref:threonine/serine ThrE exporter family protein n=1 Tax=Gordonia sp. VNK21 TaxID=3382483 RepID=UPI0038D4406A